MIRLFNAFLIRPRLLAAIGVAIAVAVFVPGLPLWSRSLVGWCAGVAVYIVVIIGTMARAPVETTRARASALDDSAPVILVLAMAATLASFGGIAALLAGSAPKPFDIGLAAVTMVLSWAFMQVTFAVHYTHIFYGDVDGKQRGGLQFGGSDDEPDIWDMLYFTTSVGATAQTSDTVVTSKTMRRIVLAQAVYSFFFNTAVLALAINIAAGLAGH